MSVQEISKDQLRRMENQEGLILQGCGGDLQEWVDGINQMLTEEGILKKGARFEVVYSFKHGGLTCLLFPFKEGLQIDTGKLAMWRLQTHPHFGSTWLSDYVPNRLGGFAHGQKQELLKPDCPLIGRDGNIFNLIGIASQTLRQHHMEEQAAEMFNRITQCQSYDSALSIIGDYVNITSLEQTETMDMEMQYLFKEFEILDFTRIHPMVQKYTPGKQFGELLIGNYDLLERERDIPIQMSLNEMLGESIPVEQILKERVTSCKKTNQVSVFSLLPVPTEVLEELELDPFSTIQYSISRGRLIIEPIDEEQSKVCFGNCCRCPGRDCCEDTIR